MAQDLKYTKLLSLQEMSLRTLVAHSFSGTDVLPTVMPNIITFCGRLEESRECAEVAVKVKLSKLGLPINLLKQAIDVVRPIALEVTKGMLTDSYGNNSSPDRRLPGGTKLSWSSVGKVDYYKTAENFVNDDSNDVASRFEIACAFCFEEAIRHLWTNLPEIKQHYYLDGCTNFRYLQWLWAHILSGDLSSKRYMLEDCGLTSFNQWAFESSAENPMTFGATATKYFFDKLTSAEKEASLRRTTVKLLAKGYYNQKTAEVIHYLLTLLTPEVRRRMVKNYPVNALMLFLFWPLQDLFVENASVIWTFLSPAKYCQLLKDMCETFTFMGYYSPKLFWEFFIQSPPELKKRFANKQNEDVHPAMKFLLWFLREKDSESIKIVFKNVDEEDRSKIVFHEEIQVLFMRSIFMGDWDLVEVCLREATLSEEDKKRWKDCFIRRYPAKITRSDPECNGFFKFFDEPDKEERGQKRKLDEL